MSNNEPITEFRYELKDSFQYDFGGNVQDAFYLIIEPPSAILARPTSVLFNEFNKAQVETPTILKKMGDIPEDKEKSDDQKKLEDKKNAEMSAVNLISMTGGDLNKCYEALREILTHKTMKPCRIDGECQMVINLYNKLSIYDLNRILSGYISNFL